jgi:hypothetical protein
LTVGDVWLWIERLSWVVAIIGIPSLVIGLLGLVRRPKIAVGFLPTRTTGLFRRVKRPSSQLSVAVSHTHETNESDPVLVRLFVTNIGRATARDLLLNFRFPALGLGQVLVQPGAPRPTTHPEHNHPLWIYSIDHIHPGDHNYSDLEIRIPIGLSAIDVDWEISMADAPVSRGTCRVIVS